MTAPHQNNIQAAEDPMANMPADYTVQYLCQLSQSLINLVEREAEALVQQDMDLFSQIQEEKQTVSTNYFQASKSFRTRVEDFRGVDRSIIRRLEDLQATLGQRTNDNNTLIANINRQGALRTQSSLLLAQEYGADHSDRSTPHPHYDRRKGSAS